MRKLSAKRVPTRQLAAAIARNTRLAMTEAVRRAVVHRCTTGVIRLREMVILVEMDAVATWEQLRNSGYRIVAIVRPK